MATARPLAPAEVLETGTARDGRAYATVASASEPGAVRTVTFADTRAGRIYRCDCPAGAHRPGAECRHVRAARAEWAATARWMARYCALGF